MQGPFKSNKALRYPSVCLFVWSLTILKRLNNWDEIWMEDSLLYRDGFRLKIWIRQFKLSFISTIFKDKILTMSIVLDTQLLSTECPSLNTSCFSSNPQFLKIENFYNFVMAMPLLLEWICWHTVGNISQGPHTTTHK